MERNVSMNNTEVSIAPLTKEELRLWSEAHPNENWQQVNKRFVGEVIAEIEGAKVTRNIAANEDVRAFMSGIDMPSQPEDLCPNKQVEFLPSFREKA